MAVHPYVLAMYDVRGKQDFIFRTNKLKEIVGASWIIRDVFEDYLKPAALRVAGNDKGLFSYKWIEGSAPFIVSEFEQHLEEGYIGEVVYDGGGNFLLLLKDEETFRRVTYEFTKDVMKGTGTLRVLGSCVSGVDFNNYKKNNEDLYAMHRRNEAQECKADPWACLPIVQVDRKTSMPIVEKGVDGDMTKEQAAKRDKYEKKRREMEKDKSLATRYFYEGEDVFDKMILKKGENSQLAVVYIDGNGMGARVQSSLAGKTTYEECVNALRGLSDEIQTRYVDEGIENALGKKEGKHRLVVFAGDEINFVVRADEAFQCARSYLKALDEQQGESACAGIAVFHSHAPYADAYRIAEEACESGKKWMKKNGLTCASLIDFHICQGAIDVSLEKIREEESADIISRPWLVSVAGEEEEKTKDIITTEDVDHMKGFLNRLGRSNVKGLAEAAYQSRTELNMELLRICSHMSDALKKETEGDCEWLGLDSDSENRMEEHYRKLIYDMVIGYDLWFGEDKGGEAA